MNHPFFVHLSRCKGIAFSIITEENSITQQITTSLIINRIHYITITSARYGRKTILQDFYITKNLMNQNNFYICGIVEKI